jgi:YD repeat-containing protein
MRHRFCLLFTFGLILTVTSWLVAQGGSIRYVYDELGRLVGVIDQNGDAATYHYDPVGNLLSITRTGPGTVSIIEFTPNAGPLGGSVTIHGTGFSTTPSQNTVTFNGVAATVVSATANTLVVTIPAGATSGQLSITTPNGTTSAAFVISTVPMPMITGLSSTIAAPGTSVTITGTGFETVPGSNNVSFNVSYAALASATATQIGTAVPPGATSGRISVATPRGTAISPQDFFVPPAPYTVADVLVADRIAFSPDKVVSLGTAQKIGLLLFDLGSNQRASLKISSVSIPLVTVSIRSSQGQVRATVPLSFGGGFIDPVPASPTGTYSVVVDPASTNTGNLTLRLYDVPPDQTGTITTDGTPVTVSATVPGQNIRRTFSGLAGQRMSLKATGSLSPGATTSIRHPDGSSLGATLLGGFVDPLTLPVTGQYTVLVDPAQDSTSSVTARLWNVPADVGGSTSVGDPSFPVNITTPGQNGLYTFGGAASQRVSVTFSAGSSMSGTATLRAPDQTVVATQTFSWGTTLLEPVLLPSAGTYSLHLNPLADSTGTITVTVNAVPADISGSIVPGGSPVPVTLTAPGQKAQLTFTGTAGQRVSLHGTPGPFGTLRLLKPDSTTLASTSTGGPPAFIDVTTLPSAGTYTVLVDPQSAHTGSITLTLYDVPADPTGSLTIGGAAVPVTTTVAGQNGSLTFTGTASQQVTVRITGNTMGIITVKLLRSDGTTLTISMSSSASFNLSTQTLPSTGTYMIALDPYQANTGTMNVQVTNP